jgi:hypothetical protein
LIGGKGFWFSIVDKTKNLSQAIDDNISSIYNSLSWEYLRPGKYGSLNKKRVEDFCKMQIFF